MNRSVFARARAVGARRRWPRRRRSSRHPAGLSIRAADRRPTAPGLIGWRSTCRCWSATFRVSIGRPVQPASRPALSDLRLFDASGKEVPYLLVPNPPVEADLAAAVILPVRRSKPTQAKTSGFEADLGEPVEIDRLRIDGLRPPFLKRVRLEGSGDRARWTVLVGEGTRLRSAGCAAAADRVELRRRVVSLPSRRPGTTPAARGSPRAVRRAARQVPAAVPRAAVDDTVAFERRPSEPGRSRFHVRLPGGHCRLSRSPSMSAAGTCCARRTSTRRVSPAPKLVPVLSAAARSAGSSRARSPPRRCALPIAAPIEPQIDLVVDDGDNPPLDVRGVTPNSPSCRGSTSRRPDGALPRATGIRRWPPRYDLEAVRATAATSTRLPTRPGESRARASRRERRRRRPAAANRRCVGRSRRSFDRPDIPAGDAGLIALASTRPCSRTARRGSRLRRRPGDRRGGGRCPTWSSARRAALDRRRGSSSRRRPGWRRCPPSRASIAWPGRSRACRHRAWCSPRPRASSSATCRRRARTGPAAPPIRGSSRSDGAVGARRPGPADRGVDLAAVRPSTQRSVRDRRRRGQHRRCRSTGRVLLPAYRLRFFRDGRRAPARVRAHRSRASELRPRAAGAAGVRHARRRRHA